MEYIEIKEQIKQKLPVARDLGDSENLLELGLSSLTIMRLVNRSEEHTSELQSP